MRALRMLCLHGFRGSGSALRAQMRSLVAGLESELELLYPDAAALSTGGPGWWNAVPLERNATDHDSALNTRAKHYEGWPQTRAWAASFFRDSGPIDGVFGFSQGAALTGLLVGLRSPSGAPTPEKPLKLDFAIMVGGFVSNDPTHATLYEPADNFALPTLHLIGRADRIVPREASLALAARFKDPLVVEHDGGHVIASDPHSRAAFAEFLRSRAAR